MSVRADIYDENDKIGRGVIAAICLHIGLASVAIFGPYLMGNAHTENWGGSDIGGGDAINAAIVSSIPIPREAGTNVLATTSKGLTTSEAKPEEKVDNAVPIPDKNTRTKPTKNPSETRLKPPTEKIPEVPPNSIPYGQGGPVSGPYGSFTANNAKGGFGINNGGDFGNRYAWYVDQLRRKVQENWLQYEVDPSVRSLHRVYIDFDVARDGSPQNIHIAQSSGVPSLDQSAVRALQRIDTFGPLPNDYRGSKVSVEFWFDLHR